MNNLLEAGFISKGNTTTRFEKGPRIRFAKLEAHLDRKSEDGQFCMAIIAASMYPKLLYIDASRQWKTLSNNAPVAIHPSSTNFIHGRRPEFGNASFLTYFNIQQSKRLCQSHSICPHSYPNDHTRTASGRASRLISQLGPLNRRLGERSSVGHGGNAAVWRG